VRSYASTRRASIDVKLEVGEALALIEASFEQAKTSPTRWLDHGWMIDRQANGRMIITTKHPGDHLLEPLPEDYVETRFPETLAVQIDVRALPEGGSTVNVRLIRQRVGATVGAVLLDMVAGLGGLPFALTLLHGGAMVSLRANRRAAKLRLLRLAIEPLAQHEKAREGGPFRQ
jgi:hypothetical protein